MNQGQSKKRYRKVLKKVTVKEIQDMVCDKIVKLRVQDQLDIPANCVKMTITKKSKSMGKEVEIKITVQVDDSLPFQVIQDDSKLLVEMPYIFLSLVNKGLRKYTERCQRKQLLVK